MYQCKGLCKNFKSNKRYGESSKRCSPCGIFLNIDNSIKNCPCCGSKLRLRTRQYRYTIRYNQRKKVEQTCM